MTLLPRIPPNLLKYLHTLDERVKVLERGQTIGSGGQHFPVFNMLEHGCYGDAGHDDSVPTQALISQIASGVYGSYGATLWFPRGAYGWNTGVVVPQNCYIRFIGDGKGHSTGDNREKVTKLIRTAVSANPMIACFGTNISAVGGFGINSMWIDGGKNVGIFNTGPLLACNMVSEVVVDDVLFRNNDGMGLNMMLLNSKFTNVDVVNCGRGTGFEAMILSSILGQGSNTADFVNMRFEVNNSTDLLLTGGGAAGSDKLNFTNVKFEGGLHLPYPYIWLQNAHLCKFVNVGIASHRETAPTIKQDSAFTHAEDANRFSQLTILQRITEQPPYQIELTEGALVFMNSGLNADPSNAHILVGPDVLPGGFLFDGSATHPAVPGTVGDRLVDEQRAVI